MNDKFILDYKQMTERNWNFWGGVGRIIKHRNLRFCFWGRLASERIPIISKIAEHMKSKHESKYGIEINFGNIGGGLLLLHPFNITVNSRAILGNNVTLFKGCTIGSVRSGRLEGVPTIGNNVAILCNATVVGKIHIGNDVLIAANTFVDFDVPDHSIVFGNPGRVKHKDNAAKDYMTGK